MAKIRKIYFVGIKGVGMASLAIIAKQAGFEVGGSDVDDEFITDSILKKEKITPFIGFKKDNLIKFAEDLDKDKVLLISTGAHGGFDNPEVIFAKEKGYKVMTHGEAVGFFMKGEIFERPDLVGVSVAGTHGKTTISAMLATFLTKLGLDPSYTVGTSQVFPIGAAGRYGKGKYFVAEADEYVSDIKYDRVAKFLYQSPKFAIVNNIDFDHPDFFENIQSVKQVFRKFLEKVTVLGKAIVNGDDKNVQDVIRNLREKTITFGLLKSNDFYITDYKNDGLSVKFRLKQGGSDLGEFDLSVPGVHNCLNSLAALIFLLEIGISLEDIRGVFPSFLGTKRRMEVIGKTEKGAIIMDDYAHHPSEVKATLSAVSQAFLDKKIICIFQPHTYTRTISLADEFAKSFQDADFLIVLPIFASAREKKIKGFGQEEFVNRIKKNHKNTIFLRTTASVLEYLRSKFDSPDHVLLTMGAGDVYRISENLPAGRQG